MRFNSQPAIVLHATRWRETSLLVEVLSHEHGRIGLVARGVLGARKQALRAALQPLQRIRIDGVLRGELAQLVHAEAGAQAPLLTGEALLAGLYLAELVLRLLPRHDPQPQIFLRLAQMLDDLGGAASLAWTLRRFERDLLADLGYAIDLQRDADDRPLAADGRYRIDPERGALRVRDAGLAQRGDIHGASLLTLAGEALPTPIQLREQRLALRALIAHQLGARGLRSWGLLAEFAQVLGAADPERPGD
ncbi:MAG: DNA repair protein RecO [Proteobacteria bacterium]|nr:DNA repair protein RecO [Pseudomonadota bacterium]